MADALLTGRYRRRNFHAMPELPDRPLTTLPTDARLLEGIAIAAGQDPERLDPRVVNGDTAMLNIVRGIAAETGQMHGYITNHYIAERMYDDVKTPDDARRKRTSIRNRACRMEAAGVLRLTPTSGPHGEARGWYWELLDEPPDPEKYHRGRASGIATARVLGARPRSSGDQATERRPCRVVRRRETRAQRAAARVRPWFRRAGHGYTPRLDVVADARVRRSLSFFGLSTFGPPRARPGACPLGGYGPGAGEGVVDAAVGSVLPPEDLDSLRGRTASVDAIERQRIRAVLQAALAEFLPDEGTEDGRPGPGGPPGRPPLSGLDRMAADVAAWQAGEPLRRATLERLAQVERPGYAEVAQAFFVVNGRQDWHRHARRDKRDRIGRALRRYDRWAPRLAALGEAPPAPTGMTWLIEAMRATEASRVSPGYWAGPLDQASKELRRRCRELDQREPGRREARAQRRIRKLAAAMRAGVSFRRPGRIPDWVLGGMAPSQVRDALQRNWEVREAAHRAKSPNLEITDPRWWVC